MHYTHNVYLDCDQVLTDFIAGSLAAVGIHYPGTRNWPEGWTYNYFRQAGTTREEVNKHCTADFWANLQWMEDGREILNEVLARFRPAEFMVLTKPMLNNGSYTGKMIWFEKNCPELYERVVPTLVPKEEFAYDFNSVLIDDCQDNVQAFINAGGASILVPRPWNQNNKIFFAGDAVSYVAEKMDKWVDIVNHPAKSRKEQHV
jgi:hypothetical protein